MEYVLNFEEARAEKPRGTRYFVASLSLDAEDPEFARAFEAFADKTMLNEDYNEVLQYMGTYVKIETTPISGCIIAKEITHEFRHRALPGTNERMYWRVPASEGFQHRLNNFDTNLSSILKVEHSTLTEVGLMN